MNARSHDPLTEEEIKLASNSDFGIPKQLRLVLGIVAVVGIGLIVMESLAPNRPEKIELDKIIHFLGYAALALTFSLALKTKTLILSLLLAAMGGVCIEFLQQLTGRSFDVRDMIANGLGLACGTVIGLIGRWLWSLIERQLAEARAYKKLKVYERGEVIVKEGQQIDHLKIIKSGRVQVTKRSWHKPLEHGEGGIIGLMAALKNEPQYTTIRALENTVLYEMDFDDLRKDAGGREAPVSLVMNSMADTLLDFAQRVQDSDQI
ncbi:MAG: VanZ family protein [Coraliomargarita sp.]